MSKTIKILDERETQKQKKWKKNRTKGTGAIAKGWEINDSVESLSF